MLSISPSRPEFTRQMAKKLSLSFPILEDSGNTLAAAFGLVITLPEKLREVYLSFGIDLERHNGNDSWQLPMPASYIIASDGTIKNDFVNIDHTVRPEPNDLLQKLKELTR